MASAQSEPEPADEPSSAASEAADGVGPGKTTGDAAVEGTDGDLVSVNRARVAGVNTKLHPTSNSKELRAREAEEDRALIAKAQTGDTAAFRSLVERHQRRAFAIAYSLVRDENDARELVQDAFLRVFKGLGTFQGGSSFFTWLYRIVTNLSIDLMRKPGRIAAGSLTSAADIESSSDRADHETENLDFPLLSRIDGSDPADVLRRHEIAGRIQTALDALPPYHRSVIVMREVEGLSYDEMAQVMGVSKGTIMSRLFHARQKLQKALYDCYSEQVGTPPPGGGNHAEPAETASHADEPSDAPESNNRSGGEP